MITKTKLRAFIASRYPNLVRDNRAGGWGDPDGSGKFLSEEAARMEAEAELDAARDGIAKMPEWAAK